MYSLAGHLKIGTVEELKNRLTARELTHWFALYELDPWGETRADWRHANCAAAICRTWGSKIDPSDLVVIFDRDPEVEQRLARQAFCAWVDSHNIRNGLATKTE